MNNAFTTRQQYVTDWDISDATQEWQDDWTVKPEVNLILRGEFKLTVTIAEYRELTEVGELLVSGDRISRI